MSKGKVSSLIGEPHWKADYLVGDIGNVQRLGDPVGLFSDCSRIAGYSGDFQLLGPLAVEEWLFDQGDRRLMQLLRSEDQLNVDLVRIFGPYRSALHFRSTKASWWYYNQGPNRLFRIIKFVNGRVVELASEVYGQ